MKTIKRIVAVFLLIIILLAVGYLRFTGSRLQRIQDTKNDTEEVQSDAEI